MATTEPRELRDEWVGVRIAVCPGCKGQRWYGYGACSTCGEYLDENSRVILFPGDSEKPHDD